MTILNAPKFMTMENNNTELLIAPKRISEVGNYQIEILLKDAAGASRDYQMRITVENLKFVIFNNTRTPEPKKEKSNAPIISTDFSIKFKSMSN